MTQVVYMFWLCRDSTLTVFYPEILFRIVFGARCRQPVLRETERLLNVPRYPGADGSARVVVYHASDLLRETFDGVGESI
jgi:hypothetical protein